LQEIKGSTLCSADGGKTWHAAHQFPHFDRRSMKEYTMENKILASTPVDDSAEYCDYLEDEKEKTQATGTWTKKILSNFRKK
jgi:predicted acyl esterase